MVMSADTSCKARNLHKYNHQFAPHRQSRSTQSWSHDLTCAHRSLL